LLFVSYSFFFAVICLDSELHHPEIPQDCKLLGSYELVLSDDYFKELLNIYEQVIEIKQKEEPENKKLVSLDLSVEFANVLNKIEAGNFFFVSLLPSLY
jgi:hypothetical protein